MELHWYETNTLEKTSKTFSLPHLEHNPENYTMLHIFLKFVSLGRPLAEISWNNSTECTSDHTE